MLRQTCRLLSADSKDLASMLFKTFSKDLPHGVLPVDPRGMKFSQLKRHLRTARYEGDVLLLESQHPEIVSEWQRLYESMLNGSIALPGREKAGPLTFHKVNDQDSVRDLYDKDGRIQH